MVEALRRDAAVEGRPVAPVAGDDPCFGQRCGVPGDESHQRVVGIPLVEKVAADDQVEPDLRVCRGYLAHREAIETAMVGTQLLGVLFAIFMRFLPLLLLVARRLGVGHSLCEVLRRRIG